MRLELCDFKVKDVVFGSRTRWQDGVLHVDRDALLALIRQDPLVADADVQLARPGESARIIDVIDIIEPRIKAQGEGTVYPGVYRRSGALVGAGRTHRLGGMTVTACSAPRAGMGYTTGLPTGASGRQDIPNFIDMSGPGADSPYSSLFNLCLIIEPAARLTSDEAMGVVQAAQLRVSDFLAAATLGQAPTSIDTFDLTPRPGLPGLVYINGILSPEAMNGSPYSPRGAAVYGVTRLTQPWLLYPTELMDGAVFGNAGGVFPTWTLTNTVVLHMCRRHGIDFNFLGCIMVRTMWEEQWQKQLMCNLAARLASMLGATGAVVTPNWRGQRFVETIMTVQACERAGIKSVLITEEEDDEDGTAPPLLVTGPEVVAVVSTGTGSGIGPYLPVKRVIGAGHIEPRWFGELPPPHGRYSTSHLNDVFGFSRLTCVDF